MDKTHSDNGKGKRKGSIKEGFLFLAIIIGVIAFFVGAAGGSYDPGEIFPMLFGFVVMGSLLVAVIAFAVAIFNRLIGFLAGKK